MTYEDDKIKVMRKRVRELETALEQITRLDPGLWKTAKEIAEKALKKVHPKSGDCGGHPIGGY